MGKLIISLIKFMVSIIIILMLLIVLYSMLVSGVDLSWIFLSLVIGTIASTASLLIIWKQD